MTYHEEIKKMLLDRLVIGLILCSAIYYSTIQIEKIKSQEVFNITIQKTRIVKIAEVWTEAALFEEKFDNLYYAVNDAKHELKMFKTNTQESDVYKLKHIILATKELEKARERFISKIRINSFYLGKALETQLIKYHGSFVSLNMLQKLSLNQAVNGDDYDYSQLLENSRSEIDKFRANIEQIRQFLIKGDK